MGSWETPEQLAFICLVVTDYWSDVRQYYITISALPVPWCALSRINLWPLSFCSFLSSCIPRQPYFVPHSDMLGLFSASATWFSFGRPGVGEWICSVAHAIRCNTEVIEPDISQYLLWQRQGTRAALVFWGTENQFVKNGEGIHLALGLGGRRFAGQWVQPSFAQLLGKLTPPASFNTRVNKTFSAPLGGILNLLQASMVAIICLRVFLFICPQCLSQCLSHQGHSTNVSRTIANQSRLALPSFCHLIIGQQTEWPN